MGRGLCVVVVKCRIGYDATMTSLVLTQLHTGRMRTRVGLHWHKFRSVHSDGVTYVPTVLLLCVCMRLFWGGARFRPIYMHIIVHIETVYLG